MSSPRIIKLRSDPQQTPAWAPDAIATLRSTSPGACKAACDPLYLVSPPLLEEAAHERAARIIAEAHAEALACVEAAKAQARERGAAEASRAAQEQREHLAADVSSRLEALVGEINQEREQFFSRVEPEIASLAVSVAEKVIAQEISAHPEIVLNLVRNSMKRMKERETLRVRLNPQDLDLVRTAHDDLIAAVDGVQHLELVEDRRVDSGGCIVESRNGNLDARIKTQLAKIARVISEGAHGDTADAGPVPLPTPGEPDGSGQA